MSSSGRKRKRHEALGHRVQMVLAPRNPPAEPLMSDASTVRDVAGNESNEEAEDPSLARLGDFSIGDLETPGEVLSDDSMSSLGDEENPFDQDAPTRDDMEVKTGRWDKIEVNALMDSININRAAIKYNFDGPGGGKDIKRQGWKDIAAYVSDVAHTNRTVKQCRTKTSAYTGRVKAKYDRLRFEVAKTGKGKIRDGLQIKKVEAKALDYLREEAVQGIAGIQPTEVGGIAKKPAKRNVALLWTADRKAKPEYTAMKMKRQGIPKNYKDKNKRRVEKERKEKARKDHEMLMKKERRQERDEARLARKTLRHELRQKKKERKDRKEDKGHVKKKVQEKHKEKVKQKRESKKKPQEKKDGKEKKKVQEKTREKVKTEGDSKKKIMEEKEGKEKKYHRPTKEEKGEPKHKKKRCEKEGRGGEPKKSK